VGVEKGLGNQTQVKKHDYERRDSAYSIQFRKPLHWFNVMADF
jgi:hypothetical protein